MSIRTKQSAGLLLNLQGISDSDFAYDCIADLFRRDAEGAYFRLRAYFGSIDLETADDPEILVYLRRLASSAVNQGVFRAFNDCDPALGKIIRSIKISVQTLRNFTETEVFGESCIAPISCDHLEQLDLFDRTEVARQLSPTVRGNEKVPEMLAALSNVLRCQSTFSRNIPIVTAALAFRDVYLTKRLPFPVSLEMESELGIQDVVWATERACANVKAHVMSKYVGRGKVSAELFDSYFCAIREYLLNHVNGNGNGETLYSSLKTGLVQMTPEEYKRKHRSRLEY